MAQMKSTPASEVWNALTRRHEPLAVIGLGVVGLNEAIAFACNNFRVVGYDINAEKVAMLAFSPTTPNPITASGSCRRSAPRTGGFYACRARAARNGWWLSVANWALTLIGISGHEALGHPDRE